MTLTNPIQLTKNSLIHTDFGPPPPPPQHYQILVQGILGILDTDWVEGNHYILYLHTLTSFGKRVEVPSFLSNVKYSGYHGPCPGWHVPVGGGIQSQLEVHHIIMHG